MEKFPVLRIRKIRRNQPNRCKRVVANSDAVHQLVSQKRLIVSRKMPLLQPIRTALMIPIQELLGVAEVEVEDATVGEVGAVSPMMASRKFLMTMC
tara:strand:+ start:339 stop:626 length:288 start_codon:yes stop_codon:yes gene_type:complete